MSTQEIATEIDKQIDTGTYMSLGAHNRRHGKIAPTAVDDFLPSLIFNAKILPFKKDGTRGSAARVMQVSVGLNARDLYDVRVTYRKVPRKPSDHFESSVVHFEADDVDVANLNRVLLALDYDGDTTLNPRYV